jgi:arylsulfatase
MPDGVSSEVNAPVSTLDVRSTIKKEVASSDGVSLFEEIDPERTVFSQARGEYENEHLWRYSARRNGDVCLCERHRETNDVEFTGEASRELRNELEEHVERRIRRMNGEELETEDGADAEIERRLEALGYKE